MDAFDAGDVEKACGVADDGGAGGGEFGQALQAAFAEGARAVGDAAAAREGGGDGGGGFEALEFFKGGEVGVLVVEADDEADGDFVAVEVV
ncbi:hypothetical protein HMPREF9120_00195 [Neisseria sp. oral taxon 020 str. F0370]|nr:hypothetical protein HMPREF9120_00195 [Neisseria sp. oral taxon 020 str. F0370]